MKTARALRRSRSRPGRRAADTTARGLAPCPRSWQLEPRQLPAALALPAGLAPVTQVTPVETIDQAQALGDLGTTAAVAATGSIGTGAALGADVAWYHFTLDRPAVVTLGAGPATAGGKFQGVLSLYNDDPSDPGDALDPLGHRLTAQAQAAQPGGTAALDVTLPAGGYEVAVSGAGNRSFNPYLAGSGYTGSTGAYNLLGTAAALNLAPGGGPAVIASDPAPGAVLDRSPLAIRIALSAPLDPATVAAGQTVRLIYNPGGTFGDGRDVAVGLGGVNYSDAANELQIFPARALAPGAYRVIVSGDTTAGNPALAAPATGTAPGAPLGSGGAHPKGRDDVFTFRVTGIEGSPTAPDTAATAHDLGDVTGAGLVQAAGAIGNDPYYDASRPDPGFNPGNGVEMYHFRVSGPGRYAFLAEVFAGRIGSPLDAGAALYRLDPATHALRFVTGNNNTEDPAAGVNGQTPLSSDPALFAALTAGDYYVAVSSGSDTPAPLEGQPPGTPGLYDPAQSHSGQAGFSTGPYVLNLLVQPAGPAPRLVSSLPADHARLTAAPTALSVTFSAPVNLRQLAFQAYQTDSQSSLAAVYVLGSDGTKYFPRLDSFDAATDTARFLMLDALPDGKYEFHLSGAAGLTGPAGDPLAGNTPGGDEVVSFAVKGGPRGDHGDPLTRTAVPTPSGPQDLGVIFPHEWQAGVTLTRDDTADPAAAPADTQESYRFRVLQPQSYIFSIDGTSLTTGLAPGTSPLSLTDDAGKPVAFGPQGDGSIIIADLLPGAYVLHVGSWTAGQSPALTYTVHLKAAGTSDNPPPLVDGPSPVLPIHLDVAGASPSNGPGVQSGPVYGPGTGVVLGGGSSAAGNSSSGGPAVTVGAFAAGGHDPAGAFEVAALGVGPVGGSGMATGTGAPSAGLAVVSLSLSLSPATTPVPTSLALLLVSTRWDGDQGPEPGTPRPEPADGVVGVAAVAPAASEAGPPADAVTEAVAQVATRWALFRDFLPPRPPAPLSDPEPAAESAGGPDAGPTAELAAAGGNGEVGADGAPAAPPRKWTLSLATAGGLAFAFVRARQRTWVKSGSREGGPAGPSALKGMFTRRARPGVGAPRGHRPRPTVEG